MGHSKAEKAQSRARILTAAATQVREAGLEGISIGALMKSVNLTHGGFYGHFGSRDALIAAALAQALADGERASAVHTGARGTATVKSIVNSYLSPAHRDHPGTGCAIPSLVGEVSRAGPEVRAIMADQLEQSFATMAAAVGGGGESDQFAVSAWSMMIGAMMLSRLQMSDARGDQILAMTRKSILELAVLQKEGAATQVP